MHSYTTFVGKLLSALTYITDNNLSANTENSSEQNNAPWYTHYIYIEVLYFVIFLPRCVENGFFYAL